MKKQKDGFKLFEIMSLDKAIKYKKEKRAPYRGSKSFACSCRNHGSCSWCRRNRLYKNLKRLQT